GAVADRVLECMLDVIHLERDVLDAITVEHEPHVVRIIGAQRRRQHKCDLPLPQDVPGLVLYARLEAFISNHVEAKGIAIEIRRLPGVADKKTDMIDPTQRKFRLNHMPSDFGEPGSVSCRVLSPAHSSSRCLARPTVT